MTPPRLTPEHEAEIHAEFRKSGRLSALSVAYLLDELDAVRKERDAFRTLLPDGHLPGHRRHKAKLDHAVWVGETLPTPDSLAAALTAPTVAEVMTCRHIWEADDQGVQCCALCGVRAR